MRGKLIGSAGPVIGREFDLDRPLVTIGRRDENQIVIKDPTVSRNHAEIRQEGEALILSDRGSTSGTLVNGVAVEGERVLNDGDIIVIGSNATFAVQIQPDEDATIAFSREGLRDLPSSPPAPGQATTAASAYQDAGRTGFMPNPEPAVEPPPAPQSYTATPPSWQQPAAPSTPEPPRASDWPIPPPAAAESNWGRPPTPPGGGWLPAQEAPPQQYGAPSTPPPLFGGGPGSAAPFPPPAGNTPPPRPQTGPLGAQQAYGGEMRAGDYAAPALEQSPAPFSAPPQPGQGPQAYGAPPPTPQGPQAYSAPPPAPQGRSRRGLVIGLAVLAVLFLAALIVGALVLYNTLT